MESNNVQNPASVTFEKIVDTIIRLAVLFFFVRMVFHYIETFRFNFDVGCCNRNRHLSFVQYFYKNISQAQNIGIRSTDAFNVEYSNNSELACHPIIV